MAQEPAGPGAGAPEARGAGAAATLLLALAVAACYGNAVSAGFVYDDIAVVRDNVQIRRLDSIPRFFTTSYWRATGAPDVPNDLYRPLVLASFALDYRLWGLDPRGHHLTNVVLHFAVAWLLWALLRRFPLDPRLACAAALLFAVHAAHTEAVTGVVGRAELLSTLFALLALGAYGAFLRGAGAGGGGGWFVAALAAFFLALLAKEMAVMVPVLALVLEPACLAGRAAPFAGRGAAAPRGGAHRVATALRWVTGATLRLSGFAVAGGAYLALRVRATGVVGSVDALFQRLGIGWEDRLLTMAKVFAAYARLMVVPHPLLADHRWNVLAASLRAGLAEPEVLLALGVLAVAGLGSVLLWRRVPPVALGIAWFYLALFPVSSLVFPVGVVYSERALYLPSVGACVALACLLGAVADRAGARRDAVLAVLVGALAIPWGTLTVLRNRDWRDQESLYRDLLAKDPENPRSYLGLAQAFLDQGDYESARAAFDAALARGFTSAAAYRNRGVLCFMQGQYDLADRDLTEALRRKRAADIYLWRAKTRERLARANDARDDLMRAVQEDPGNAEACGLLGESWLRAQRPERALEYLDRAAALDPRWAEVHVWRSAALEAVGRLPEALVALVPALLAAGPAREGAQRAGRRLRQAGVPVPPEVAKLLGP